MGLSYVLLHEFRESSTARRRCSFGLPAGRQRIVLLLYTKFAFRIRKADSRQLARSRKKRLAVFPGCGEPSQVQLAIPCRSVSSVKIIADRWRRRKGKLSSSFRHFPPVAYSRPEDDRNLIVACLAVLSFRVSGGACAYV